MLCDNLETKMKGTPGENTLKWLFCGKMRNYIRCCNVEYKSERIEEFYDLSFNVKGIPTILGSFRQYVEAERMQGDNKYACCEGEKRIARSALLCVQCAAVD